MKQPCEDSLRKLLEREMELPSRYAITAKLMLSDIEPLKEDSLDEVARMMNDVERRLSLGRTGKQVRDQEQAIIEKLDKMIEKMEQQQQQQQQQRKQQQQQRQQQQQQQKDSSQQKASDQSAPGGGSGEGEVDNKDIGDKSGWGNLPPAARQEALQSMTKDLPSHYREVIEAYFKRLSKGAEKP
jgi:TolA-binding protein